MKRFVVLLSLAACADEEHRYTGEEANTSALVPIFQAVARGDGTTNVSATMYIYNTLDGGYLKFSEGDLLVAHHEGTTLSMMSGTATFPIAREGAEFEVSFLRAIDAGAPSSRTRLPPQFDLAPVGPVVSRSGPVRLSWQPSDGEDEMSWYARGDCVYSKSGSARLDEGMITVPPLEKAVYADADECLVSIVLRRQIRAGVDPAYMGGAFLGVQEREVVFLSVP